MRLLVISDAHLIDEDGLKVAYAPYVKEMDLWMKHVDHTTFISPNKINTLLLSQPFKMQQFHHVGVTRLEFNKWSSIVKSLTVLPRQILILWRAMRKADHIHLRAPGNLTLLACMVQIFLPLKAKTAKYAGNWDPRAKQPFSYRLQRWFLSNTSLSKNIKVLVYGDWRDQSHNIKSFFTATYTETNRNTFAKSLQTPLRFVFVGTLSKNKNPHLLVELIEKLNKAGIPSTADFYGDGPMLEELVNLSMVPISSDNRDTVVDASTDLSLSGNMTFHGNQSSEIVQEAYKKAHFLFLASDSEGWPKAVAEAMWHGCVPIATPVSCIRWMLDAQEYQPIGNRGIIHHSIDQTNHSIERLLEQPEQFQAMSIAAQKWSQQYTMERFEQEIKQLLHN
jgi:glycosyltransferase involved in cell wall biosynthesis